MEKLEYIAKTLANGSHKIYETYVINAIYQRVNNPELEIVTQKSIKLPNGEIKKLDYYLPQFKLVIEVDEGYHESASQKIKDKEREYKVKSALTKESVISGVTFERVSVEGKSLEEINQDIERIVEVINKKIIDRGGITWLFGKKEIDAIKERGIITTEDCFSTNYEIINLVYNKNLKNWQRASYNNVLWFPVISQYDRKNDCSTDRNGWINYFSNSKMYIFEKSNIKEVQVKKKEQALIDKVNKKERITFVKEQNEFGGFNKRFAGVFIADGWDPKEEAERWKLIKTELKIPLTE